MKAEEKFVSEHQRELYRHYYNGKEAKDEKQPKLILNQMDKNNYVVHIKALQFYMKKGMKLMKGNVQKLKATLRRICSS